mmetsp:Transcript_2173/g.7090  ORF Transcript_2173/g.7090 Transcript_2173/m.7090 type:complete len:335 (-) Transcript_2173:443-1447(-)
MAPAVDDAAAEDVGERRAVGVAAHVDELAHLAAVLLEALLGVAVRPQDGRVGEHVKGHPAKPRGDLREGGHRHCLGEGFVLLRLRVLRGGRVVDEVGEHSRVALRLVGLLPTVDLAREANDAHAIVVQVRFVVSWVHTAAAAPDLLAHCDRLAHCRVRPERDACNLAVARDVSDHPVLSEVTGCDVLQRVVARIVSRRLLPDPGPEAAAKVIRPDALYYTVEQRAVHEDTHGRLLLAVGVQRVGKRDVLDVRAVPFQRDEVERRALVQERSNILGEHVLQVGDAYVDSGVPPARQNVIRVVDHVPKRVLQPQDLAVGNGPHALDLRLEPKAHGR